LTKLFSKYWIALALLVQCWYAGATAASGTAATTSAGAFALYTNNTRALQAQAATATPVLVGLRNALSTIAAIGVITVAVNML
jgi:hypothetical protein